MEEGQEEKEDKEISEVKEDAGKKPNKLILVLVVGLIILVGLGILSRVLYRRIAERMVSKNVTVKTSEGTFTASEGGKLPDNFPNDFPVYAQAKLTGSWSAQGTQDGKGGTSVIWETDATVTAVSAFYKTELAKAGWKVSSTLATEGSTTLSFSKETVSGFIGITKGENGKTTISVTLGGKE